MAHTPQPKHPRRKVATTKMKSKGTMLALPLFNPVQGTADIMPSGSNLAGPVMGKVEPNTSGAMPNPPTTTGLVTGYRTAGKTPMRRYSSKRPAPKAKATRIKSKLAKPAVRPPVSPPRRRMTIKAHNSRASRLV